MELGEEVLAVGEKPAAPGQAAQQPALDRIGQQIVLGTDLLVAFVLSLGQGPRSLAYGCIAYIAIESAGQLVEVTRPIA